MNFCATSRRAKRSTSPRKASCLPVNVPKTRSATRACSSTSISPVRTPLSTRFPSTAPASTWARSWARKIAREWEDLDIDVVIPIPETSCDIALEIARILDKPYRQGFVKNRYVGRTFIMPGQQLRRKSVRRKLNANRAEFRDKNVLLVDDSIVRGTTSEQIIEMAREAGAKKVYLASAAPEIRFPNVYGIDMPTANELIAHGREVDEIRQIIGADGLIFQDLNDLIEAVRAENPDIQQFECSVFNGVYVTKDVDQQYLDYLDSLRNDDAKAVQLQTEVENLEMHNEG